MGPSSHPCFTSLAIGAAETNGITGGVVAGGELEFDAGLLAVPDPVEDSRFEVVIDPSIEVVGEILDEGDAAIEP